MFKTALSSLSGWWPQDSRPGLVRRGLAVWTIGGFIGLFNWAERSDSLGVALAYSLSISMSIWFCTDVLRVAAHRWLGTAGPYYWALSPRMAAFLLTGIVAGYVLGVVVGDAYSGRSTLVLIWESPVRFWGFLFSSAGISLAFLAFFYQREKGKALERQATEARLKLLETQLEPHMLFNTLANLRALIETDPPRALTMLDRLNSYLRATLAASRTEAGAGGHTLEVEFERLRDYLDLMAVRMGDRLVYELDLPEDLAQHPLPALLLQPIVENAVRHGLEPKVAGGSIVVKARRSGHYLELVVADTGVGMMDQTAKVDTSRPSGHTSFGLAQVRERLDSLPGSGPLQVHSQIGRGTEMTLRLPLLPLPPTPQPANSSPRL